MLANLLAEEPAPAKKKPSSRPKPNPKPKKEEDNAYLSGIEKGLTEVQVAVAAAETKKKKKVLETSSKSSSSSSSSSPRRNAIPAGFTFTAALCPSKPTIIDSNAALLELVATTSSPERHGKNIFDNKCESPVNVNIERPSPSPSVNSLALSPPLTSVKMKAGSKNDINMNGHNLSLLLSPLSPATPHHQHHCRDDEDSCSDDDGDDGNSDSNSQSGEESDMTPTLSRVSTAMSNGEEQSASEDSSPKFNVNVYSMNDSEDDDDSNSNNHSFDQSQSSDEDNDDDDDDDDAGMNTGYYEGEQTEEDDSYSIEAETSDDSDDELEFDDDESDNKKEKSTTRNKGKKKGRDKDGENVNVSVDDDSNDDGNASASSEEEEEESQIILSPVQKPVVRWGRKKKVTDQDVIFTNDSFGENSDDASMEEEEEDDDDNNASSDDDESQIMSSIHSLNECKVNLCDILENEDRNTIVDEPNEELADEDIMVEPSSGYEPNEEIIDEDIMKEPSSSYDPNEELVDEDIMVEPSSSYEPNEEFVDEDIMEEPSSSYEPNEEFGDKDLMVEASSSYEPNEELVDEDIMVEPSSSYEPNEELVDEDIMVEPSSSYEPNAEVVDEDIMLEPSSSYEPNEELVDEDIMAEPSSSREPNEEATEEDATGSRICEQNEEVVEEKAASSAFEQEPDVDDSNSKTWPDIEQKLQESRSQMISPIIKSCASNNANEPEVGMAKSQNSESMEKREGSGTGLECNSAFHSDVEHPQQELRPEQPSVNLSAPNNYTTETTTTMHNIVPSTSELFIVVDRLFLDADQDTVTVKDIVRSVANHFNLPKVQKEMKRTIKARLTDLIQGNVEPQCSEEGDEDTARELVEDPGFDKVNDSSGAGNERAMRLGASEDNAVSKIMQGEEASSKESFELPQLAADRSFGESETVAPSFADKDVSAGKAKDIPCPQLESNTVGDREQAPGVYLHPKKDRKVCLANQQRVNTESKAQHGASNDCSTPSKFTESSVEEDIINDESFMSGTLFQNLSPDFSIKSRRTPRKTHGLNHAMESTSMSNSFGDSMKSRNVVEKGKWSLGSEIGAGSFGRVYMGMNAINGSIMAVKVLQIPSDNKHAIVEDMQREIDLMKTLKHPNIVRYLGAEVDNSKNILHIFQEWAPGGSISALLGKFGPFSITVVKSYVAQILKGLDYLHSHGIIHRDIKGGNILVSNDGAIKLADFGASKRVEALGTGSDEMELTMRGTPYFMAPEVFEEKYGSKADIWSVGGVIYQMTTGSPPWKGMGFKSPISLFMHLKSQDGPPKLPQLKDCDGGDYKLLESILSQCFQREPSMRPSASTLLNDEFINGNIAPSPKSPIPMVDIPAKIQVTSQSPISDGDEFMLSPKPTFQSPLNQIPENAVINTSLADSLCYSLTLQSPFPKLSASETNDKTEWPEWAKNRNKENTGCTAANTSSGEGTNPFAKKSPFAEKSLNISETNDKTEWPEWAKKRNKENIGCTTADKSSGKGENPFAKKSPFAEKSLNISETNDKTEQPEWAKTCNKENTGCTTANTSSGKGENPFAKKSHFVA